MNECVVIAGASSGIGRAAAEVFLAAGWDVVALARRAERLRELAEAWPGRVVPLAVDVTDEAQVQRAVAQMRERREAVHALVTSAGDFSVSPIAQTSLTEFERIWRVSVLSKFLLTRELLPLLLPGTESRHEDLRAIVHVSSLAAHQDFPNESAYGSSMHAILGLARSQDAELRDRGVRVSVVSPGLVRTELTERSGFPVEDLNLALKPAAMAESILYLVRVVRQGGYIPEIFHVPAGLRY
jgi:3-oxoacyl-[acyl-carrier protein] reductase